MKELTLVDLVREWKSGQISLDEMIAHARVLEWAVRETDEDGSWFEGNPDNSIAAVQSMVDDEITIEDFEIIMSRI